MSSAFNITQTIAAATPATASTAAATKVATGLDNFAYLMIDAELTGGTGGTLDVYLQRAVTKNDGTVVWYDWAHFAQVGAGLTATYSLTPTASGGPVTVGKGTSPVLAAGACVGGHPGESLRALFVAGAGTSAAGSVVINITGIGDIRR